MKDNRRAQKDENSKTNQKIKSAKKKKEKLENSKLEKNNKKDKNNENTSKKLKKKDSVIRRIIKKLILFIILALLMTLGVIMAISAFSWKELAEDMFLNTNSVVLDKEGKVIAKLGVEQKKVTVPIDKIPRNLINAYISIEDERFYSHYGIDIKRTGGAILSYITNFGNSSYGGSTITQQLVKNLTGDTQDSITRKVKEWWKAFLLECYFDKDEIIEMYLNVIYIGPNVYGVQTGAKYYFNKDVSKLSLAESAYLAGLNHSPNSYNPFENYDNEELINKRTLTVLNKMLELGYINNEEYAKAEQEVEEGLHFKQGEIETENPIYSYHTDALILEAVNDLAEEKNISETFATNYLNMAGLTIYSTQNSEIQKDVETEFLKQQYMIKSSNGDETAQAGMVILNHQNGQVLGCVGGLGEKQTFRGLNRATQSKRQTGSAIKPLAVLVPGINEKIFTPATIYNDKKTTFENAYNPANNDGIYLGRITVRRALESSQNVPFVEMMEEITPQKSISYLNKMGITSLTAKDEGLPLALGGLQYGITPLEMAGAYATIANDGNYVEPTFYTTIVDNNGKIILKTEQETRNVFSEQVAFVVKKLLQQPVEGTYGTASYCMIPGVDVAAKTGTTDENFDKWLCGFTSYYTGVTWFGFDQNETIDFNHQNPAGIIWANVMKEVHSDLSRATFRLPNNIEVKYICADTGMVAKSDCNNTYPEYFLSGTVPKECTTRH